ncbi:SCO family protein [Sulfitobacter sp. LCG007]
MTSFSTRTIATAAVIVTALFIGGTYYLIRAGESDDPFAPCRTTQVAGGTESIGGPFELVNAQGRTVTDGDVITEPSLVYFGYTFCPDVCPFDMARNSDAVDLLAAEGVSVTPVFISIDPKRDTPEVVGEFAANLHDKAIGLTGSPEQVKAASQAYRTFYKAHDDGEDEFYPVDHSTFTYLVLPGRGFVEYFRHETTAEDMARTTACFAEKAPER